MAELLFWPALLGYGEAAIAYTSRATRARRCGASASAGSRRRRCSSSRRRASTPSRGRRWAGSLNLFVWLDRRRLPDLGLPGPLPPRRAHGHAARRALLRRLAPRRRDRGRRAVALLEPLPDDPRRLRARRLRRLHARRGARLALPARGARLQRRAPDILALRLPSLVVLERLTVRTIAVALPLLTVGLVAGFVRLREQGGRARRADGGRRSSPGSSTPASSRPAPPAAAPR